MHSPNGIQDLNQKVCTFKEPVAHILTHTLSRDSSSKINTNFFAVYSRSLSKERSGE